MGLPTMDYLLTPSGPETDKSWTDDLPLCVQTGKKYPTLLLLKKTYRQKLF